MRRRGAHVHSAAIGLLVTINVVLSACGGGSPAASPTIPEPTAAVEPTSPEVTLEPPPPAEPTINTTEISGPLQDAALVQALRTGGLLLWMQGLDGATVMIESSVGFRVIPDGVP
jgi:hypothetical protein